jgi:hypothetical protein
MIFKRGSSSRATLWTLGLIAFADSVKAIV